jgi:sugar/nucleoside kinase (ribokinase family)
LKNATTEELEQVMVLADFKMKALDNRVEYDIFYSSSIDLAHDFIQDFIKLKREFGKKVLMTPQFVFCECQDYYKEYM